MPAPPDLTGRVAELQAGYTAERLGGGSVNRTWLLISPSGEYVLRQDTSLAIKLQLDRRRESRILQDLRRFLVGPELIYAAPEEGLLVTRYIAGHELGQADLRQPQTWAAIGGLLSQIHAIPATIAATDYAYQAAAYSSLINTLVAERLAAEAGELAGRWCSEQTQRVLCHHDTMPGNIIRDAAGRLRLIDWEYAGLGEPCMDLAVLLEHHRMTGHELEALLAGYGEVPDRARLEGCRALYRRLAVLWLMVVTDHGLVPDVYRESLLLLQARL